MRKGKPVSGKPLLPLLCHQNKFMHSFIHPFFYPSTSKRVLNSCVPGPVLGADNADDAYRGHTQGETDSWADPVPHHQGAVIEEDTRSSNDTNKAMIHSWKSKKETEWASWRRQPTVGRRTLQAKYEQATETWNYKQCNLTLPSKHIAPDHESPGDSKTICGHHPRPTCYAATARPTSEL